MANLPKEAIEEFKKLYAKHYGVKLSDEEASRRARNLVDLFAAVYGDNSNMINRRKKDN
jgi:hypothetical protein